ncbi:hypothetical protein [Hydrogenophaga sp.]|uniref:hypothetical protein n=1 Tax=Hydrogenophaga sp. TaxID=1904254 RepID=UPI00356A9B09
MTPAEHTPVFRWLLRHWLISYVLMAVAFVVFGAASLNLVHMFSANIGFLWMYGWDAIQDGALWQLAELVFSTALAVCFYLIFKTCEHVLVQRIAHKLPRNSS